MKLLAKEEEDPIIARVVEAIVAAYHIQVTLAERPDAYGSASLEAMAHASTTSLDQALQGLGYTPARIRKLLKDYGMTWHNTRHHTGNVKWSPGGDFAQDHPANVRYLRSRLRALAPDDPGRIPTSGEQLRAAVNASHARSGLPQPQPRARVRTRPLPTPPPEPKSPPVTTPEAGNAPPTVKARHRVRPAARQAP